MPRETIKSIAAPLDAACNPARAAPHVFDAHLGFLLVVIAPALFWAAIVFGASLLAVLPSAPQLGIAVFALTSAFLTFICRALRIRI